MNTATGLTAIGTFPSAIISSASVSESASHSIISMVNISKNNVGDDKQKINRKKLRLNRDNHHQQQNFHHHHHHQPIVMDENLGQTNQNQNLSTSIVTTKTKIINLLNEINKFLNLEINSFSN